MTQLNLSGFPILNKLYINYNKLSNLQLSGMENSLSVLGIYDNNISDISYLSNFNSLVILGLGNNEIEDISSLASLSELWELGLSGNKINNIESLGSLNKIKELSLSSNEITNIDSLENLKDSLEKVYLTNNPDLVTNDDINSEYGYYPRSDAREVIETLLDKGVDVYWDLVFPWETSED